MYCQPSISHGSPQSPLQPHPSVYEILRQNAINDGREQVPSNHSNLEHQGWGQIVRILVNRCPYISLERRSRSSLLDDLHHKRPILETHLKVSHSTIPNAIFATNVVVVLLLKIIQPSLLTVHPHPTTSQLIWDIIVMERHLLEKKSKKGKPGIINNQANHFCRGSFSINCSTFS